MHRIAWVCLCLLGVVATASSLLLIGQSYEYWQQWRGWQDRQSAVFKRHRQHRADLQWWMDQRAPVQALLKRDEAIGQAKQTLWQDIRRRALERHWRDVSWRSVPTPPRDKRLAQWSRQRFHLQARVAHERDLFTLWDNWRAQWGDQLQWPQCHVERLADKDIQAQSRPLTLDCQIEVWQWHAASRRTVYE